MRPVRLLGAACAGAATRLAPGRTAPVTLTTEENESIQVVKTVGMSVKLVKHVCPGLALHALHAPPLLAALPWRWLLLLLLIVLKHHHLWLRRLLRLLLPPAAPLARRTCLGKGGRFMAHT